MKTTIFPILIIYISIVSFQAAAENGESPALQVQTLSADSASIAVLAAYQECSKRGFNVAVAVVGRDGRLLAFVRSPLSGPHTIDVSQAKAYTALTYQSSTMQLLDRAEFRFTPGVLLLGGGVPIQIGGHLFGAIGVSGAPRDKVSGDNDDVCARFGIAKIQDRLEFAQ